jgi:hypothetical protein
LPALIGSARQRQRPRWIDPLEGLDGVLKTGDALEQRASQVLTAEIAPADGLRGFAQPHAMESYRVHGNSLQIRFTVGRFTVHGWKIMVISSTLKPLNP